MNCPACDSKRLHATEEWEYHPYAGHGYNGHLWTHQDLGAATSQISGECSEAVTAPGTGIGQVHDDLILECQMVDEVGPRGKA